MREKLVRILLALTILLSCMASSCQRPDHTEETSSDESALEEVEAPKATITQSCMYLFAGDTYQLPYTLEDSEADPEDVEWSSSDDCVTVQKGSVTAVKEGYAYVSAGNDSQCLVYVLPGKMPVLRVNTEGSPIASKKTYTKCSVSLSTENEQYNMEDISAGIRLRGNSTAEYAKKPYRIKFEKKQNLLGMNEGAKCKSWVLLADYLDDTKLRNSTAFSFASVMLEEYSSDWRYVTLEINGTYQGVYLLCEQNQINKNRIDIEEAGADTEDLLSGYLLEIDASYDDSRKFEIDYGGLDIYRFTGEPFTRTCNDVGLKKLFVSVKNDGLSEAQFRFIEKVTQNIFTILYAATFENVMYVFDENYDLTEAPDLSAEEVISRVIDIDSMVRMYLFCELICNSDEYKKSFFLWIDLSEEGKLTFGCPWDFDGATVEWNSYSYHPTDNYFAARRNLWFVMVMNHKWFRDRAKQCWQELYDATNGFASTLQTISKLTRIYKKDFEMDLQTWGHRAYDNKNHTALTKQWLNDRIKWLNNSAQFGTG